MNKRFFIEVKNEYKVEDKNIARKIEVIDLFDLSPEDLLEIKDTILHDPLTQTISETLEVNEPYFAYEAVDGQYDQKLDWLKTLLNKEEVKTSTILVLNEGVNKDDYINYNINPLEYTIKDLNKMEYKVNNTMKAMEDFTGFINFDKDQIKDFYDKHGLAMEIEDLFFIQDYFIKEGRDPIETEIRVLDTYWSDHCRHTTFMSELDSIIIDQSPLKEAIEESFKLYLSDKEELGRSDKAISLMDVTAQNGRYAKKIEKDDVIEVSDEVNACSIRITVDNDGVDEPWLLMFKNETHNHPTEIEPFGGASTCIGGAIRDPLSGRAYVYQAMRITGAANVLESNEETHPDKLAQSFISKSAAEGYSHYARQIGITASYVKEIYHDSYKAKRMELGAVVGAIKESDLIREQPQAGDVVVMLGGRTGRDGVGGATGSSDVQSLETAESNAAEVQKGNALEERKIIRLFKDPVISRMIKKSNDFGAGGVSVAIGELADGLDIDLSKVLTKYDGLNPTELAISESQERMAVVLDKSNVEEFIKRADKENVETSIVAHVTDTNRLVIRDQENTYVDLDRNFVDSGGITQHANAHIVDNNKENPLTKIYDQTKENLLEEASRLENASQAGLAQYFDAQESTIKPLLGKTQLTPNIGSVQSIPLASGRTNTVSVLTHGFIPSVSEYSPFVGGSLAVVESVSKTVALGGDYKKVYLSFQEYFNRLTDDKKWGNVLSALLGTYKTQRELGICAIGGKDSMSGTYEDLNVVDTLVSFACSPQDERNMVDSVLKEVESNIYLIPTPINDLGLVDFDTLKENYETYHNLIQTHKVLAASTSDDTSILFAAVKMALGNKVGFEILSDSVITAIKPGSILFQTQETLDQFELLARTNLQEEIILKNKDLISLDEIITANTQPLNELYPFNDFQTSKNSMETTMHDHLEGLSKETVNVLVPVFPGTSREYALIQELENQGASVTTFVYSNNDAEFAQAIEVSDIIALADGSVNGDLPNPAVLTSIVFNRPVVKEALNQLMSNKKLILGFGNGFQTLVKTGLLPHGQVQEASLAFTQNSNGRHVAGVNKLINTNPESFWTQNAQPALYQSSSTGRLVGDTKNLSVLSRYKDINPTGSHDDIEALASHNGLVFGRMSETDPVTITNAINYVKGAI